MLRWCQWTISSTYCEICGRYVSLTISTKHIVHILRNFLDIVRFLVRINMVFCSVNVDLDRTFFLTHSDSPIRTDYMWESTIYQKQFTPQYRFGRASNPLFPWYPPVCSSILRSHVPTNPSAPAFPEADRRIVSSHRSDRPVPDF